MLPTLSNLEGQESAISANAGDTPSVTEGATRKRAVGECGIFLKTAKSKPTARKKRIQQFPPCCFKVFGVNYRAYALG